MKLLCILVSLAVAVTADYHEEVGIPLAARVKAYEDKLFAEVPEMRPRLVGKLGETRFIADPFGFPFMASMILELDVPWIGFISACSGSIVSKFRLVTAAHCLKGTKTIRVRVGSQYLFEHGTLYRTSDFSPHPLHDNITHLHDIGVVRITQGIEFSDKVQPVALPLLGTALEKSFEWAKAVGFGIDDDKWANVPGLDINQEMFEVDLRIIPKLLCGDNYTICTDGDNKSGHCNGDSGGPLLVVRNHHYVQSRNFNYDVVHAYNRGHRHTNRAQLASNCNEHAATILFLYGNAVAVTPEYNILICHR